MESADNYHVLLSSYAYHIANEKLKFSRFVTLFIVKTLFFSNFLSRSIFFFFSWSAIESNHRCVSVTSSGYKKNINSNLMTFWNLILNKMSLTKNLSQISDLIKQTSTIWSCSWTFNKATVYHHPCTSYLLNVIKYELQFRTHLTNCNLLLG